MELQVIKLPVWTYCGGFPGGARDTEPAFQFRKHKRRGFDSWIKKVPWSRKRQPTLVFLLEKSHGLRSCLTLKPERRTYAKSQKKAEGNEKLQMPKE